jgi:hypothetical protein
VTLCQFDGVCPAFAVSGSSFCAVHRWAFNNKAAWEKAMRDAARLGQPKCEECDGVGKVECDNCGGTGETDACECPNCYGHDCDVCDDGKVQCEGCEGTGLATPTERQNAPASGESIL